MRTLTMDELEFVSGGETVVVTGSRGAGNGPKEPGSNVQLIQFGSVVGEIANLAKEAAAEGLAEALFKDFAKVINGSDPEGDRLLYAAIQGKDGLSLGASGKVGSWNYRSVKSSQGTFYLWDNTFNGVGSWDRVSFTASNGGGTVNFYPGGLGGTDGYH